MPITNRSHWNRAKGYDEDSKFELELRRTVLKDLPYHPTKIPYFIEHTYEPDWIVEIILDKDIEFGAHKIIYLIEAKGMFRDASELQKYTNIQKQLPPNMELVFLFQKPNAPIYFKPKRKDGSKLSHKEWAELRKFRWFTVDTIKELLNGDC